MHRILLFTITCLLLFSTVRSQPVAFPGAEGFGKYATGGRGGKVIVVTNLNDDGEGSLRDAIQKKVPRIIVFAVSGNVELSRPLDINYGNVTIAGQSAPGDGVCLKNYTLNVKADNVIIRFLRFRMGDEKKYEGDAISGTKGNRNIIIDHCSVSWSTDECASFYNNKDFTLQWCIISESLNSSIHGKGNHGYGGIWGGKNASFHHNLIASHTSRLPRFSGSASTPNDADELVDFRNNVIYNWVSNNIYGGENGRYNVVSNYFKPGPATKSSKTGQILNPWSPYGRFFLAGNVLHGNKAVTEDNHAGIEAKEPGFVPASAAFPVLEIPVQGAEECFEAVLEGAGASLRRDKVDMRIADEVRTGRSPSGKNKDGIIDSQRDVGGWPELKSGSQPADKDRDGIPDAWERANGLNVGDGTDACKTSLDQRYDNIEVYVNDLIKDIMNIEG